MRPRVTLARGLGLGFALPLALAACGSREPQPAPDPTPTVVAPRTLVGADLDLSTLGAKIVGPQGAEVESVFRAGDRRIGKMVSYVACPREVVQCKPDELPEGTVFTYVHRVTLAEASEAKEPQASGGPEVVEAPPTLFRTTRKTTGFNQAVGFSTAEAEAALGDPDAISITMDNGSLIWRVARGPGWQPGMHDDLLVAIHRAPAGPRRSLSARGRGKSGARRRPLPRRGKTGSQVIAELAGERVAV